MSSSEVEYDKCISCREETKEPTSKHIDYRDFYVEGAGQLCEKCFLEIYES
tara:strand:- start:552 stop:704 length:153 start_codon:yes stop_codon:yes gene_type:complete